MKTGLMAGWSALGLGLAAVLIGAVPGAVSLMGLALLMFAMMWSLVSIPKQGNRYFYATAAIALPGLYLVNDAMSIWNPSSMPCTFRVTMHALAFGIFLFCFLAAYKLREARRKSGRSLGREAHPERRPP